MREFHIWIASEGSKQAFPEIDDLSLRCHFRACTHTKENKCAVLEALATGTLPRERYDGFLKLQLEIRFLRKAEKARRMAKPKEKRSRSPARVQRGRLNWSFLQLIMTLPRAAG